MQPHISIRGRVRPSVRPSVGRSDGPVLFSNDENRDFWGWKDFEWPTTTITATTMMIIMINECRQKGRIWCTPAVLVFDWPLIYRIIGNKYRGGTSDAFCRHSFIIIIIIVIVVVGHWKYFRPQKPRFSSFEKNTGPTDGRTDQRTDGHNLL